MQSDRTFCMPPEYSNYCNSTHKNNTYIMEDFLILDSPSFVKTNNLETFNFLPVNQDTLKPLLNTSIESWLEKNITNNTRPSERYTEVAFNARIKEKLIKNLVIDLKEYDDSNSSMSFAERNIIDIVDNYGFEMLKIVVSEICKTHFSDSNTLVGICRSLERYEYRKVASWGCSLLRELAKHKSDDVKSGIVDLINCWETKECLPILKTIKTTDTEFKNYINIVIERIKKSCSM